MNKLIACVFALLTVACGDGTDDRCVDGVYDGNAVLTRDGFVFETYQSLLSPGSREVVPYSAAPFRSCCVLGGILMQSADAVLDSEHYPLLEELGFITIEPLDNGGPRIVDDLSGFDDVVRFGGIGNPWDLERVASVGEISGFNSVEVIEGSLRVTADLTGFASLRDIEGSAYAATFPPGLRTVGDSLQVGGYLTEPGLPNLERIGGDLLVQLTQMTEIGFPALQRVGGDLILDGNDRLERWGGLRPGSSVGGGFDGTFNSPIRDEDLEAWVASGATTIAGPIRICANQSEGVRTCSEQ